MIISHTQRCKSPERNEKRRSLSKTKTGHTQRGWWCSPRKQFRRETAEVVAGTNSCLHLGWKFYFKWDSKPRSKWVWFLFSRDLSDCFEQNGSMVSTQVRGHFLMQALAWTLVTGVGRAGNSATAFTGKLQMGNRVMDKLGVWLSSGWPLLPFIERRKKAKGTSLASCRCACFGEGCVALFC